MLLLIVAMDSIASLKDRSCSGVMGITGSVAVVPPCGIRIGESGLAQYLAGAFPGDAAEGFAEVGERWVRLGCTELQ
ncbi:hypothetical protein CMI37_06695 [Candidatus Pacearchaeota archaeon]|nr:hypothetical protein [Candidatus Pacearchaeota archaeon]